MKRPSRRTQYASMLIGNDCSGTWSSRRTPFRTRSMDSPLMPLMVRSVSVSTPLRSRARASPMEVALKHASSRARSRTMRPRPLLTEIRAVSSHRWLGPHLSCGHPRIGCCDTRLGKLGTRTVKGRPEHCAQSAGSYSRGGHE